MITKSQLDKMFKKPKQVSDLGVGGSPVIRIGNSYSHLRDFPKDMTYKIKNALTYENEDVKKNKQRILMAMNMAKARKMNKYYFALKQQLADLGPETVCWLKDFHQFPTGLLSIVEATLQSHSYAAYTRLDERTKPEPYLTLRWNNKPHDPRPFQAEVITLAEHEPRGVVESCVGSGKTLMMTYIIKQKEVNTLIVVPSLPLVTQTSNVLSDAFGSKNVQVIKTDVVKKGKKLSPIRIASIQTLAALQKSGLLQAVTRDIDMILLDEVHHAGSVSYGNLLDEITNVYFRYGFSATFLRNDSKTLDMYGVLSNVIYNYPPKLGIEQGYITPVTMQVVSLRGRPTNNYQREYDLNYCGSNNILQGILSVVTKVPEDDQILILVDRKDKAGVIIHDFLTKQGISNSYISGDDNKDTIADAITDFNDLKIRVLVASTVIGEGVDIRSTKHLILARGGKSEIAITQAIGRCVRLYPGKAESFVYDFCFLGTKFLEKHARMRMDIFKKQFAGKVSGFQP